MQQGLWDYVQDYACNAKFQTPLKKKVGNFFSPFLFQFASFVVFYHIFVCFPYTISFRVRHTHFTVFYSNNMQKHAKTCKNMQKQPYREISTPSKKKVFNMFSPFLFYFTSFVIVYRIIISSWENFFFFGSAVSILMFFCRLGNGKKRCFYHFLAYKKTVKCTQRTQTKIVSKKRIIIRYKYIKEVN